MKKALLILLLALMYAKPSIAQSTDSIKKELGFSTHIVLDKIFKSFGAPVELMVKKHQQDNKWIRYGLSLNGNFRENDYTNISTSTHSYVNLYVSPSVGFEYRHSLLKKWSVIYGGDLYTNLIYQNGTSVQLFRDYQNEQKSRSINAGAGIRPFIGLVFNITQRLYLSTEAFANVGAYFGKSKQKYTDNMNPRDFKTSTWGFDVNVSPASSIFVYYRF